MSPNSTTNSLIFSPGSVIRYGGNRFINVPVILETDGIPLIETVQNNEISRTTRFTIFNADGVSLAKVTGTFLSLTMAGEKTGLKIAFPARLTVCTLGDLVLFEIRRAAAAAIVVTAELFSPKGFVIRSTNVVPFGTFALDGGQIAAATIRDKRIRNSPVGYSITNSGKTITLAGT